jgi:A/G-specific adenine glycosylase
LLGGLWEFVSSEFRMARDETLSEMVARRTGLNVDANGVQLLGSVKHAFTHFRITRRVYLVETRCGASLHSFGYQKLRWTPRDQIIQLALTRSDQKILDLYEAHQVSLFAQAG